MDLLTPDFGLIFWQVVILLVVLWILGRVAWRPILGAIQYREDSVATALAAAEEAKKLVEQVQVDKEALLQTAYIERKRIVEEAIAAKQLIIEQAQIKAEEVSQRIIAQTNAVLKKEKDAAIETLRQQTVVLAVQIAEKLLQNELQQQGTHEQLIQRLIKEVRWR